MKGIVFSQFIELAEATYSPEIVDEIITQCDLPSQGGYTAVGTYDHSELVKLVIALSDKTDTPIPDLMQLFGKQLLVTFTKAYPEFFSECSGVFSFLKTLDNHIHVEVRKLYPDAELPKFSYEEVGEDILIMEYHSERGFADLALGLLHGCVNHYNEKINITKDSLEDNVRVKFTLSRYA